MQRNFTRIHDYFRQTFPWYLPNRIKWFSCNEKNLRNFLGRFMQTAQIPAGNSERPVYIFPENQILMFLWRIGNQEQARTVADLFCIQCRLILYHHFRKKRQSQEIDRNFWKEFPNTFYSIRLWKEFQEIWSDGTRPRFPQNGTKSDNRQTSAMELHRTFLTNKLLSVWKM